MVKIWQVYYSYRIAYSEKLMLIFKGKLQYVTEEESQIITRF